MQPLSYTSGERHTVKVFADCRALFRCVLEIRNPQAKERQRGERERERERARDPVATLRKLEKIDPDPKNNNSDEITACSVQT